jgi:hypothetical protein
MKIEFTPLPPLPRLPKIKGLKVGLQPVITALPKTLVLTYIRLYIIIIIMGILRSFLASFLLVFLPLFVADGQYVPSMFFFGNSVFDVGNNNYLFTLIKSNFPPYGKDFTTKQPSGRFYNGRLASDFAGSSFSNSPSQSFSFFSLPNSYGWALCTGTVPSN